MKILNENIGFNKYHGVIIFVVVTGLALYASPALGFDVSRMFKRDTSAPQIISYEGVRSQVVADMGLMLNPDYSKMQEQLALIDRGVVDTKVLGDAIGVGDIPSANEMQLPEMDQMYPLNIVDDNSIEAVLVYKKGINDIETRYSKVELIATLNSSDTKIIKDSLPAWRAMLKDMSILPVPNSLASEYRARLGFYFSMMKTAEVYAGIIDESELPLYLKAVLAFSSKVQNSTLE